MVFGGIFFPSFLYPPHRVKQIHKSYCTQVLQSANIRNSHELVYTFHFLNDKNNQKALLLFFFCFVFVQSGSIFMGHKLRLILHSRTTVSPDLISYTQAKTPSQVVLKSHDQKFSPSPLFKNNNNKKNLKKGLITTSCLTQPKDENLSLMEMRKPCGVLHAHTVSENHAQHAELVLFRLAFLFLLHHVLGFTANQSHLAAEGTHAPNAGRV